MANAVHSKLTVVKLDTAGGVLTDISTLCNKFDLPETLDLSKTTCFGATSHAYLPGFANAKVSMGGPWSRALDNLMSAIKAAFRAGTLTSVSFEYGPEGSDTGDVKYTGELIMTDYKKGSSIEDPVDWSAEFQVTGDVTVGAY